MVSRPPAGGVAVVAHAAGAIPRQVAGVAEQHQRVRRAAVVHPVDGVPRLRPGRNTQEMPRRRAGADKGGVGFVVLHGLFARRELAQVEQRIEFQLEGAAQHRVGVAPFVAQGLDDVEFVLVAEHPAVGALFHDGEARRAAPARRRPGRRRLSPARASVTMPQTLRSWPRSVTNWISAGSAMNSLSGSAGLAARQATRYSMPPQTASLPCTRWGSRRSSTSSPACARRRRSGRLAVLSATSHRPAVAPEELARAVHLVSPSSAPIGTRENLFTLARTRNLMSVMVGKHSRTLAAAQGHARRMGGLAAGTPGAGSPPARCARWPRDRLGIDAAQLGQRAPMPAAVPGCCGPDGPRPGRNVRRIGFEHDGFERQPGRQAPDLQRARKRHGAAEAELQPRSMKVCACWKLPLKAWAMPPAGGSGAGA
jgi:hypothetical protein